MQGTVVSMRLASAHEIVSSLCLLQLLVLNMSEDRVRTLENKALRSLRMT